MFQFLIGTIQTDGRPSRTAAYPWFQFLIGTIQTRSACRLTSASTVVSIPHRYDPNFVRSSYSGLFRSSFQFLIGTIQTMVPVDEVTLEEIVSIPHRYDPNMNPTTSRRNTSRPVSIPHRYDPNSAPRFAWTARHGSRFNSS